MKILTVVGARPQFIKAAALSAAIRGDESGDVKDVIVHTGQHYDTGMSSVFFDELSITAPAYNLGVGSESHGVQTGAIMMRLEPVVVDERPDWVLVYGDTNTTLAAAVVAAKLGVRLAHVEAGLRSFDRSMPEEVNRVLTDHVSNALFCPSSVAVRNLAEEGIRAGVHCVGDVMFDILLQARRSLGRNSTPIGAELPAARYGIVTLHRAANTDQPPRLMRIIAGLNAAADAGLELVWPVHPRLKSRLTSLELSSRIRCIAPVSYFEMIGLMSRAAVVATDSGGLQKEAMWCGVPCVTLRDETEWPETIDAGWNQLVGADTQNIARALEGARAPSTKIPDVYGKGDTGTLILQILKGWS